MENLFTNVSWGEFNFTELVNAIIAFVYKLILKEVPELDKIA